MRDAGWSKELEGKQLEEEINEALGAARAWMEIVPERAEENPSDSLKVGEMALLTVKSTLPGKYRSISIFLRYSITLILIYVYFKIYQF